MPKTRLPFIDSKIQYGRGRAASVLGETYNVFRLLPTANQSIINSPPIIADFDSRNYKASKRGIENQVFDILVFSAICDNRKLLKGDILVQTGDYRNDHDIFTVVQYRPTRETLFVRTENSVSLSRPTTEAGAAWQQPSSGVVETEGWAGTTRSQELKLVLKKGSYSFSNAPGSPAAVFAGLQPLNRVRDGTIDLPSAMPRLHFLIYLSILDGEMISEFDCVNFPNQDRYRILSIYSSDLTGFSGYICITEKIY